MIEDTSALRDLSRRLLAHEGGDDRDPVRMAAATDRACRTLYGQFSPVIGDPAFQAWAYRALRLTQARYPLPTVAVEPGGCLSGLQESAQGRDPAQAAEAFTSLLTNFLVVFVGLMGKNLSMTFLRDAWPDVEID
ncbi:MAG: hypothetical protein ACYC4L_20925 [Chloroflexota bacterium]